MNRIKTLFITASALLSAMPAFAQITFKELESVPDTVSSPRIDLVFQTSPQAKAQINGEAVPVYKTGAFGKRMQLIEGENTVDIKLTAGQDVFTKTYSIVFAPKPRTPRLYTLEEAQMKLDRESFKPIDVYAVSNEWACLQYGDGSDRLGGSKMGYIEPGIPLKLVGTRGDLFKVQLSENRWAYIHHEDVTPAPVTTGVFNSSSLSIFNDGNVDKVSVSLPQRVPYASWTELDPTTICVDLFGVTNNSNWVTHRRDLGMIDYVDIRQIDSDVLRLVIRLKEKFSWGYSIKYNGNNLSVCVKHAPKPVLKGMVIGLDAGHGGSSRGAISYTGIEEKDVNLKLVYMVKEMLEAKGAKVVLARDSDKTMTMTERKKILTDGGINLLVSIHNNAGGSPFVAMGTSTYYKSISNRELAACLIDRILELGVGNCGLVGNFNFSLCAPTEYPCALVEGMFMSSLPDEEKIADPAFLKQLATKVVNGLEDYLAKVKASQKK